MPAALNQVERQSGYYKLSYDNGQLGNHKAAAEIKGKHVPEAVNILLRNISFMAKIDGRRASRTPPAQTHRFSYHMK